MYIECLEINAIQSKTLVQTLTVKRKILFKCFISA